MVSMLRKFSALSTLMLLLSACGISAPPTVLVMEVTREIPVTVVVTLAPPEVASATAAATLTPTGAPSETPSTATLEPSPTVNPFPTPVIGQIYIADQRFQRGRMFWLQPVEQIWVISTDRNGKNIWSVYQDSFEEGMQELDPTLTPPANLLQPERGFGMLWRSNRAVQSAIGWGISPELGYQTRYEYHAGGSVNEQGQYLPSSGYHILETLNGEQFKFVEGEWTWEQLRP